MKGKILNFNPEKGFGFILGEDNNKYFFHISKVSNPMDINENYIADFEVQNSKKGLNAINITITTPLSNASKDKMLKIEGLRIRASNIKEYKIEEIGEYSPPDYQIEICTYTSGKKYLRFGSSVRAYECLDYLDQEMDKFL